VHRRPAGHILVRTLSGEWSGPITQAYSDFPAVDILNLIQKAAVATCLFCCSSCAVLVAYNLQIKNAA